MKRAEIYAGLELMVDGKYNRATADQLPAAYEAVDSERNYQNARWGNTLSSNRPGSGERSASEFALYIDGYVTDVVQVASHFGDASKKLEGVRKVTGLAMACLEQHSGSYDYSCGAAFKGPLPRSIDEYILAITGRSRRLTAGAYSPLANQPAPLQLIQEIALLGIQCMALHGAPLRQPA